MEEEIEVKLRNHKDAAGRGDREGKPLPLEQLEGVTKTHEFTKEDARTIHFPVKVAKDGETRRALSGALHLVTLRESCRRWRALLWVGAGVSQACGSRRNRRCGHRGACSRRCRHQRGFRRSRFGNGRGCHPRLDPALDCRSSAPITEDFRFRRLRIHVQSAAGHGVKTGSAFGTRGGMIRVVVGREVSEAELRDDWILVHEMTHLALPDVGRVSTSGSPKAWPRMSKALPAPRRVTALRKTCGPNRCDPCRRACRSRAMPVSTGLTRWGRTYWGGALFCLMADVEIRRRTENRFGLQDAMRAVARDERRARCGLVHRTRVCHRRCCDAVRQCSKTCMRSGRDRPVSPDLPALWRDLGIESHGDTVRLRDDAAARRDPPRDHAPPLRKYSTLSR